MNWLLDFDPVLLASAFGAALLFGTAAIVMSVRDDGRSKSDIRKRLEIAPRRAAEQKEQKPVPDRKAAATRKIARKASEFYALNDPRNLRKLQMRLLQAGVMHENAVGKFLAARVACGVIGAAAGVTAVLTTAADWTMANRLLLLLAVAIGGYMMPSLWLKRRLKAVTTENRLGFPDVMDLMIVAAEAGLTLEASIERIALEIRRSYPVLSHQLGLAALEIRAGRPVDQALRNFGERLGLPEVQGFATMIQQSKELGTSIADALRVYSDEMRHRRMMVAEERAYALPAKLSIPVTAFILPVVIGVAVLPTAVRMMHQ